MAAYGITNNVLVKNNFLFGYKIDDNTNASIRVQNNGYRKDDFNWTDVRGYFDCLKVDFVSKYQNNNVEYGIEVLLFSIQGIANLNGKAPFEQALIVFKQNYQGDKVAKVRVSSKFNVSVSYRFPALFFKNIAATTLGLHGSNLLSQRRVFKFGAQI